VTVSYLYFRFKRSDPGHNKDNLVSYDIHIFTGDFFIGIFLFQNFNEIYFNMFELFSKIWKGGSITPRYRLFTLDSCYVISIQFGPQEGSIE